MDWTNPRTKGLIQAFLALRSPKEAQHFLRDLMTEGEIEEFGKRLHAADMLRRKESYAHIQKETGLSAATVARVSKWFKSEGGGYRTILHRLQSTPRVRGLR